MLSPARSFQSGRSGILLGDVPLDVEIGRAALLALSHPSTALWRPMEATKRRLTCQLDRLRPKQQFVGHGRRRRVLQGSDASAGVPPATPRVTATGHEGRSAAPAARLLYPG